MVINDTLNKFDNSNMLCTADIDEGMAFYIIGDTLSFQKQYYSSATNYEKLYVDRYDLVITKQTDTSLTVRPTSLLSKSSSIKEPVSPLLSRNFTRTIQSFLKK